jgi:HEAT repeat protein
VLDRKEYEKDLKAALESLASTEADTKVKGVRQLIELSRQAGRMPRPFDDIDLMAPLLGLLQSERDEAVLLAALEGVHDVGLAKDLQGDGGAKTLPVLVGCLGEGKPYGVRLKAVETLASVEKEALPAAPKLVALVKSGERAELRAEALDALAQVTAQVLPNTPEKVIPGEYLPLFTGAVESGEPRLQLAGAYNLRYFGSEAVTGAAPVLVKLLEAEDPRVVMAAANALGKADPGTAKAALPDLAKALARIEHQGAKQTLLSVINDIGRLE